MSIQTQTGAIGTNLTITSISPGVNGPPGPQGSTGPSMGITAGSPSTSLITINAAFQREVLRITPDGEVIWSGKPSEAADIFENMLSNIIDKRIAPSMRQRTYIRACQSILSKARTMEKQELIEYLEKSIENRKSHEIMLLLRDD